uniref:F-box domain-containing protein n=1 Tax=Oryza glumipatula TaxID=40148 RepID=A0A0E0BGK5_9ORYZ
MLHSSSQLRGSMVLHSPIPTAGLENLASIDSSSSGAAAEAADCESARPPSLLARILHCEFQAICCSRCSLDARRLFDGMPPGEAPPPTGGDRIGDLPDGVLQHILGFLPPHEAVRTCVLARRWRHLWKSVAALRITNWDWRKVVPMEEFRYFVHHLLLRCGRAPIDEFELDLAELSDRDTLRVNRWFRHAVMCQARVLRLDIRVSRGSELELENLPVVSRHLQKLDLYGVKLMHNFLDFSSCPVLQHLEIAGCDLSDSNARKISSLSIKHLNISGCNFSDTFHTHIYAPNLLSLGLVNYMNQSPVFEGIPLLTEAVVGVGAKSGDWNARPRFDDSNNCMLPEALSQAKKLVLLVQEQDFNFEMYWQRCPTFSKLKTLLISACASAVLDFEAVSCILRHLPVLENLTLQFHRMGHGPDRVEMKGSYSRMDKSSAISEYLKIVVVRFDEIDDLVIKFELFLRCCPDARLLFDVMLPGKAPAGDGGVDRLGDLPDEVLQHILGFLPAQEAVQTCVLARRWRHLWKSVATLCITRWDWKKEVSKEKFLNFVHSLLFHRGRAPMDKFDLNLSGDTHLLSIWFREAAMCQARVIRLNIINSWGSQPELDNLNLPVVSRHLAKLQLSGVKLMQSFLDFSSCPVLEHLEIVHCDLSDSNARKISSLSLKHLYIFRCNFSRTFHTQIYAPNLVYLGLVYYMNRTPVFEGVPLLTEAVVGVAAESGDWNACPRFDDSNTNSCMLPEALSQAKKLVLEVEEQDFNFKMYWQHCPTFSKLKTLFISVCISAILDFEGLSCILRHSPVLEILTLQFHRSEFRQKDKVEMKGSYSRMEKSSAISEHLKIVAIQCDDIDDQVIKVLKLLSTFSIREAGRRGKGAARPSDDRIGHSPAREAAGGEAFFVFKRDMMRCPTFSNLKTLLLIDSFYVAFDLHGITCILRHSPVLEKLTLELFCQESEHILEMKGSYNQTERSSAISEHLKSVVVKCGVIDERVTKVLKFLSTFNIPLGLDHFASTPPAPVRRPRLPTARPPSLSLSRILHSVSCGVAPTHAAYSTECLRGKPHVRAPAAAAAAAADLPDGVLQHILGFLPAPEAVRTCVLARRWRHLWKSVARLHITNWDKEVTMQEFGYFVHRLLLHRGRGVPIDEFRFSLGGLSDFAADARRVDRWFRHAAVMCQARVLQLRLAPSGVQLALDNLAIVSRHLEKLQLTGVKLMHSFLDFSSCPVLEHLDISFCNLVDAKKISSRSLKHLNIFRCFFSRTFHTHICAPNLLSLRMFFSMNRNPVFEGMPLLTEAFVGVTGEFGDWNTPPRFDDSNNCTLPQALSHAKTLVLIVLSRSRALQAQDFNSNRYWQQCPIFSRLKTLSICELISADIDFEALSCILQHSPILEKLTLKFRGMGTKNKVEMKGSYIQTKKSSAISEHLKLVVVKCGAIEERVIKVLKFLSTFNILLHHIIGLLPAPDAVRTCVLARRWRHLWKSATGLRIADDDGVGLVPMEELHDFVDHLLLLRGRAPLDTCELSFAGLSSDGGGGDARLVDLWFRHAVLCEVQALRLNAPRSASRLVLDGLPLVSRRLAKLELAHLNLVHNFLDFSSCPVLEHLEIVLCSLSDAERISSQSLKRLNITACDFSEIFRTRIDVPNLLSLRLDNYNHRTPVFEGMPLLVDAFFGVTFASGDIRCCPGVNDDLEECPYDDCDNCPSDNNCKVLQAFSQAKNLALVADTQKFIFKRELIRCPTFSKLKTLLLSDSWIVAFDLHEITCILRHSPVLENLTLQFFYPGPDYCVEIKGSYSRMERSSAISEHLKIVVVKCGVVDERVIKILKFLSTFNIAGARGARATDSAAGGRIRRACGARLGLLLAVVVDRRLIHQRLGDRRLFVSCRAVPFARHLFDGMPPRRRGSRGEEMAEASKEGGINALPDELLQHVLSLLSADEAVKTCVLSRRWRHLWRSTDVLRLDADKERWKSSKRFKKFVNHLVLFRGCSPLREFDLEFSSCREKDEKGDDSDEDESDDDRGEDESDEDSDGDESDEHSDDGESDDDSDEDEDSNPFQCVMMWVMYALICQVQVLKIHNFNERYIEIDGGMPLISQHLTKIELSGIVLKDCFLNFSSCPALKELYFTKNCCFDSVKKIFSQSMQCLRIFCCQFSEYHRTLIYAPSLIRLFLEGFWGRTPFLERMPSLVEASVRPHQDCDDWCSNTYTGNCEDEDCDGCHGMIDKIGNSSNCVLLGGLSEAKSLKLIAGPEIIIFGSDLRWCPMFSKLKNLLLNEWCLLSNFWALACILEHSPVLRKLTLQISKESKSMMQTEENDNPLRKPAAISEHLKVVKVHCKEVDEVVYKIGKWLSTLDIKVLIKRRNQSPKRFCSSKTRARRRHGHRHRRRRTSPTSSLATPPPQIESRYCSRVASYHGAPASHTGCFLHRGPDARRLFDGMRPQGKTLEMGKRALPRSSDGDEDRTGDLPDGILHHILGSLPARDAVRTCVLARRWRHLWKFATGLRITDREMREPAPMEKLQDFVDHLLLLRGRAPLETCWLNLTRLSSDGDARRVNLWFRHSVLCEVQVLRLDLILNGFQLKLDDLPLASRCLAKLNLSGVHLMHSFPDFSCCPVLEHLDIFFCDLSDAKKITSQSMKCLNIRHCTFSQISRTRISAPNLISLRLENYWHRTPVFEVMPLIVDAFVRVHDQSGDWYSCTSGNADFEECLCEDCDFCHSNTNYVIMQALSQAKNLVLSAHEQEFIFKRELMRCPTFSNLKTLLLINCFCVAFDLHGITSILRHTPVLEKLILEFFFEVTEHDDEVEMKGSCSQMERSSAISKHLKLVIVKCNAIDGRITKILKFLSTFNICFSFE